MPPVALVTVLSAFLASAVEFVEAVTIVLAVGVTRSWRSALLGTGAAVLALAALVAVFGTAIAVLVPIWLLRLVVGGFLVIYGLQWQTKAVLRAGGAKAKHDEAAIYAREVAAMRDEPPVPATGTDWISFTVAFKGVLLEGLEVAFIVVTFGASAGMLGPAILGALVGSVVGIALSEPILQGGLLAATKRITVFGTVHAPLFNPLIAAKEFVTADHIGQGRFGLNLVVGWNEDEFEMFGVKQREHDVRYEFAQEWLDVVKQAWGNAGEFDFDGQFLKLRRVRAWPKPYGGTRPIIMNAGSSPAGQAFALRNCDAFFVATAGSRTSLAANATKVAEVKGAARALGREIDIYTVGQVICRPSEKEAQDYYRHALIDNADWGAIDGMLANRNITPQTLAPDEYAARRRYFAANAVGGYPFLGTPDHVAAELETISRAGVRGIALSFVNYLRELPYFCDEVLPRLARLGVRAG